MAMEIAPTQLRGSSAAAPPSLRPSSSKGPGSFAAALRTDGSVLAALVASTVFLRPRVARRAGDAKELEMEAARIRAEAAALEAAAVESRRQTRAAELTDGLPSVPAGDLRKRLEKEEKMEFSLVEVKDLVGGVDPVPSERLASEDFEVKLRMLVSAKVETTRALQNALEAQAAAPKIEEEIKSVFSSEVDGEDRSLVIRVLATLVYLLPLADGFQYGVPLLEFVPVALPAVKAFAILVSLKNMIPFGTFIFLILFRAQAGNPELPQLLRYNLAQAVVLDVLFIIPDFFMSIIQMELPTDPLVALFVILFGVIVYSVTLTFLGKVPDGLGAVSDMTRRNLGGR